MVNPLLTPCWAADAYIVILGWESPLHTTYWLLVVIYIYVLWGWNGKPLLHHIGLLMHIYVILGWVSPVHTPYWAVSPYIYIPL